MGTIARMDVKLAMDASDFEGGIAKAQQSAESLSAKLGKAGAAMSLGVTAPLAGIATMALKSAGDFEQSMNVLQSVSGATASDMAALEAQALELGASTSFSAGDAANAMLELGKAGLDATAIMGAMPGVLSLAAAGNMDVGTAAGIAANAVNTFGLAATEVTAVADMLAAAANASSADVSDLAAGFQMSASVFAANGQSMSDLTTSMALMANAGIAGSDAGTSLKTMLMRLAAPTDEAAAAMSALGLNIYNADGSMRPFEGIVGDLSAATAGLSDAQRNAALSTIFGADAIRAANVLTAAGAAGFADMETQVTAAGAAQKAAAARMKGLNGALETLRGAVDSAMISLGAQFLPVLAGVALGVAGLVTGFTTLSPELQNAAIAFAAVLAAAGPLMLAISGIGAVIGFILSPIGLLVAGVAAIAAGFVLWRSNFGGIQQRAAQFAGALKEMAENATGIDFDAVADGLRNFGNYIGAVISDGDALNDWLTHLPDPVQPAVQAIGELVAAFAGLVQTGNFGAFVQSVQAIDWGGALASVGESLGALRDGIAAKLQGIDWGGALATAGGWLDGLKDGVIGAVQSVDWAGSLAAAGEWLAGLRDGMVGAVASIDWGAALTTAGEWLAGLTGGVVTAVTSIDWGGHLAAAGDWLAGLWGSVTGALTAIDWGTHLATAAGWLDALKAQVVAAIQGIDWSGALTAAGDTFGALETAVTDGLAALGFEGAGAGLEKMKTLFAGLPETVASTQQAITKFAASAVLAFAPIAAFFAPALGRLQAAFAGLPAGMAPLLPKLQEMGAAFGELVTALQPFVMLIGAGLAIAANIGVNAFASVIANLPALIGPIIDNVTATIRLISTVLTEVVTAVTAIFKGDWSTAWESAKTIVGAFSEFFRGLFSRLGTFTEAALGVIYDTVTGVLDDLGVDVGPILNGVKTTFETIWNAVAATVQPVLDAIDGLKKGIQDFQAWIGSISIPNPFAGIQLPDLGGFNPFGGNAAPSSASPPVAGARASGGPVMAGSSYLVGEEGPEIFMPSRSGTIIPNDFGGFDAGGTAGEGAMIFNHYGDIVSPVDLQALAYQVAQLLGRRR